MDRFNAVHEFTKINLYYLDIVKHIIELEAKLKAHPNELACLKEAKYYGFSDLLISSSVNPTAILAAILAIGYPVALEAKAEERDTRGLTSITL